MPYRRRNWKTSLSGRPRRKRPRVRRAIFAELLSKRLLVGFWGQSTFNSLGSVKRMHSQQRSVGRVVASFLAAVVATFAFSLICLGQANQGSIAGTVTDQTGAVVVNAQLMAKERSTGTTYKTVSSSAGLYRFPNVNIGTYDLTVSFTGFKTVSLTGVVVQVASTAALDVKLNAGAVTETISVNADAPTVQSESSDIGSVVNPKQ